MSTDAQADGLRKAEPKFGETYVKIKGHITSSQDPRYADRFNGLCCFELVKMFGDESCTKSMTGRLAELHRMGEIMDSKRTRTNPETGCEQTVWIIGDESVEWLIERIGQASQLVQDLQAELSAARARRVQRAA